MKRIESGPVGGPL